MSKDETDSGDHTFSYKFVCGAPRPNLQLELSVNVLNTRAKHVPELAARVMNHHNIPCFVEPDMVKCLKEFVETERMSIQHKKSQAGIDKIRKNPSLISTIAADVAKKYENTWACYQKPVSNKPNEFSISYHYLIHSLAMQVLLKLEQKYISLMSKFISDKELSIGKMQDRHQMEMTRACEHVGFAYTADDVTILASKHLADMERLQRHWDTETQKIMKTQKREFAELVVGLHKEMLAHNNTLNEEGPIYLCVKQVLDTSLTKPSYIPDDSLFVSSINSANDSGQKSTPTPSTTTSNSIVMEESFTVNLGAQLKTMHNIRLLVTDVLNFCRYSGEEEMEAQRFQTAMSLYSSALSAVVLLSDKRIGRCTGIEQEFASICNSSPELHFPSLDEQLEQARDHVAATRQEEERSMTNGNETTDNSEDTDSHLLKEGDFYITKHSNLSQVHAVFHVATEESQLQSKASLINVTSRHPVILALRHILKVASNYDIRTLTVPLLLTHELTEEITFQWCVKRAELVMKCMKGFMMEMATWDGGVSRNIQFVVPPGVSEEAFDRLRSALPEVFRTTSARNLTPAHRRTAHR
uniref:Uncharacterized protein C12orf4 homolog n=1 Tax=Phallusia mammillata TaxID=59560 RepID=A0A6F9DBB3_9ASCI|nr:uncharacterized protein C12orf4 homolog [Phallusia mammillata]